MDVEQKKLVRTLNLENNTYNILENIDLFNQFCQQDTPGKIDGDYILAIDDRHTGFDLVTPDLRGDKVDPDDSGTLWIQCCVMHFVKMLQSIFQLPF